MSLPKMSAMWEKYPIDDKRAVATRVGGSILWDFNHDPDYNTCCIRTSLALNSSGAPITKHFCDSLKNPYVPPKVRASRGSDNQWYIASVYDMRVYLEARFGQPKRFKRMSKEDLAAQKTGPGILMFFAPHCDLWNGSEIRYNDNEWTNQRVEQLLLWPCAPEDPSTKSPT
ncbi:MAG: T6SS effector amidase Tae4 family protein [Bryobacteraceae bacterium]|jgi:Type VI secretion system (T6SS), amidase effector protein 4